MVKTFGDKERFEISVYDKDDPGAIEMLKQRDDINSGKVFFLDEDGPGAPLMLCLVLEKNYAKELIEQLGKIMKESPPNPVGK